MTAHVCVLAHVAMIARWTATGPVKRARVCETAHTRCGTWRIFVYELLGVSRRSLALRLTDSTLRG